MVDDCGAWCGAEQSCVLYVAVGIFLAVDRIGEVGGRRRC